MTHNCLLEDTDKGEKKVLKSHSDNLEDPTF